MKTNSVVLLLVGAVALGFVGGIVGGMLFADGGDEALSDEVATLEARVSELGERESVEQTRIAFVDAEALFRDVFLPQVSEERQGMEQVQQEVLALRESYNAGEIDQEDYEEEYIALQTDALRAQLQVNLAMLDKMVASNGFSGIRADLQQLQQQAEVLESELDRMREQSRAGVLDREAFMAQLQALQSPTEQLDQLLTQVAAQKIVELSQGVAQDEGYDLALRKKEVVVYWDQDKVADITSDVEPRLGALF